MNFLFLLIIAAVAAYLLRSPLKAHPSLFYSIAAMLVLLYFFGATFGVPRWLWMPLVDLIQKCELAVALFAVVMLIGCLGKEQTLYRRMKPIRAELSIIACILCLGHMAVYLGSYLPRLLGNASINSNVAVAFGVAVALFVLLALLGVTSLGIVKRAMSSRRWTSIQRFACLFFALIFCHLALMLLPAALHGGVAAQESLFVYTAVFGAYGILRLGKAVAERHEETQEDASATPAIAIEEEAAVGDAAGRHEQTTPFDMGENFDLLDFLFGKAAPIRPAIYVIRQFCPAILGAYDPQSLTSRIFRPIGSLFLPGHVTLLDDRSAVALLSALSPTPLLLRGRPAARRRKASPSLCAVCGRCRAACRKGPCRRSR